MASMLLVIFHVEPFKHSLNIFPQDNYNFFTILSQQICKPKIYGVSTKPIISHYGDQRLGKMALWP